MSQPKTPKTKAPKDVETLETATVKVIAGFTALTSAVNNTIKSIGDALSTPARKG
jgi:hypothetical protein